MSKAILPYYFDSKENLTLLTMRWVLARVAQRIREAIPEADTAEEAATVVRALVDGLFTQWVQEKVCGKFHPRNEGMQPRGHREGPEEPHGTLSEGGRLPRFPDLPGPCMDD